MEGYDLAKRITELALEKNGMDISIVDLNGITSSFDYFVIITGSVDQHVRALSDHIRKELSREGVKPIGYEGQSNLRWVLLDFVDVIVHVFDPETRDFYKLETIWKDAKIERVE
ncbi:MAG: ribosome silencing factor [Candidatus Delongbacteria bacterium]|nr:ribosome silencing factor [Candidatus Delongbacteria bacterium]MCG2760396.1 ribosome silencing factor [Candidatus Delongbacteria bacterium]